MRNQTQRVFGSLIGMAVMSLAFNAGTLAAGVTGFQPWTNSQQATIVGEPYPGPYPWTDQLKCMTNAGYCHRFPARPAAQVKTEPYPGPFPWTDQLKCMSNFAYCHRFETAPTKGDVASR